MSPAQIVAFILQELPAVIAFIEQLLDKQPAPANAAVLKAFVAVAKQLHAAPAAHVAPAPASPAAAKKA